MNLPIVVWMLYTFFKEVPKDILEAGRMDGAKPKQEVWMLLLPLSLPGIASTALLSIILCWNEAFWSLNLTASNAGAADRVHRLVLGTGRPVLGQALGRLDDRDRADPGLRLDEPAPARARPDLRRRQVDREASAMATVTLKDIQKSYGAVQIIKGVDLADRRTASSCVFVGPSGCGKSTLLRMIAGPRGDHLGRPDRSTASASTTCRPPSAASPWCSSPTRSIRT